MTLTNLVIFARHGDRSPIKYFGNCETIGSTHYDLSRKGITRALNTGNEIRNGYKNFLESFNLREDTIIMTTNMKRTLDSAYFILKGILGDQDGKQFDNGVEIEDRLQLLNEFHLIRKKREHDIYFRNLVSDISPYSEYLCKKGRRWLNENRPLFELVKPYFASLKDIDNEFNKDSVDYIELFYIADFLETYYQNLEKYPDNIPLELIQILIRIKKYVVIDALLGDSETWKLNNHCFFQFLKSKLIGNIMPKFMLLTLHDANLIALLKGLGFQIPSCPDFCSQVVFEIYDFSSSNNSRDQRPFIKIKFNSKSLERLNQDKIKSSKIFLDDFIGLLDKGCFNNDQEFLFKLQREKIPLNEWKEENWQGYVQDKNGNPEIC